ncbi:MAG TPA: hypothetical protein VGM91_16710 [Conexibacter sp.]
MYRSILTIDGVEVGRSVVDDNDERCRDVETENDDAYEFAAPRPCLLDAVGSVAYDTRRLTDGAHAIRVEVEDAAGNVGLVHSGTIQTANAPVMTVAPELDGDARVGAALAVTDGLWDGVPTGYDEHWLRCDGDGANCIAINGAAGARYVPTAADAYHRLVAEVTAHNASGAASARTAVSAPVLDAAGNPAPVSGADDPAGADDPSGPTDDPTGANDPNGPSDDPDGSDLPSGPDDKTPVSPGPDAKPPVADGGVNGLQNPVADQGGHAPNGAGASAKPSITLALLHNGHGVHRARSQRSHRWPLAGQLTDGAGNGIANARVNVAWRVRGRGWIARGLARTTADGRFRYTLPAGPSRTVRVTYFPFADSRAFHASNPVTIDVLAPLSLTLDHSTVIGSRVVTIRGRAGGESIPKSGLLVTLQGYQRGFGWRTFRTLRTTRAGAFKTTYRFHSTSGHFAFRAVVPQQGRYPFVTTTSKARAVSVR